ncbi:MAG: hypothetical protein VX686_02700, partial [Candidatus Thermoplasmatota archaeon]|nr:hypothetical protein [Candidatus Thermoplasmatota archaeon]
MWGWFKSSPPRETAVPPDEMVPEASQDLEQGATTKQTPEDAGKLSDDPLEPDRTLKDLAKHDCV